MDNSLEQYKQTTAESCLACCLQTLAASLGKRDISKDDDAKMLFYALKFSRVDFVAGHLAFVEKEFGIKTTRYVNNKILYDLVKGAVTTDLVQKKISWDFIHERLKKGSVILLIDAFRLLRTCHYPHWIVVHGKKKDGYDIYDPWEGERQIIPRQLLQDLLSDLNDVLWMAPQLIVVEK